MPTIRRSSASRSTAGQAALVLYTGERDVAEELAQEAMARAWERWPKVSRMASPEGWTFRTARNLAISRWRRQGVERRARNRSDRPVTVEDPAEGVALRAAVAALPERQRATSSPGSTWACRLRRPRHLGCAEGTVKAATSQALDRLRASGFVDEAVTVERPTP
ncbi:MAG: sigma factor [Acidimicrobiales bacterium]